MVIGATNDRLPIDSHWDGCWNTRPITAATGELEVMPEVTTKAGETTAGENKTANKDKSQTKRAKHTQGPEKERERERERENTAATASYSFVRRRSTNQRVSRDQESCAKLRVVQFLTWKKVGSVPGGRRLRVVYLPLSGDVIFSRTGTDATLGDKLVSLHMHRYSINVGVLSRLN